MSTDSDALSTAGVVRASIDIARLPWVRSLHAAYESDFDRVASFFAGHPRQPGDWGRTIARVTRAATNRATTAAVVRAQLAARAAPVEARSSAERLSDPGAVAVVTGQQAGLFGGPLFTLLKAITAIRIARDVSARESVRAIPVFWVASEDHDWAEARSTSVVDAQDVVVTVDAPDVPGAGAMPVGALTFDSHIAETVQALAAALPATPWTADLLAALGRHYVPGSHPGLALAGWLDELLGPHGLVVFDGADPAAKPIVAALVAEELAAPERTASLVRDAGERLRALGHSPQIEPAEHATALFHLDGRGRWPIRFDDGAFLIGDNRRTPADLLAEAAAHPERFSPNVMLRPVAQDRIFPTICYVAGPGELAYHAQLGGVYEAFGIERPLLASRASATLLDPPAARFMDRYRVALEELAVADDSILNAIVERELDPAIGSVVDDAARVIDERLDAVKAVAAAVDPTLAGTAETTRGRVRQAFDTLHDKIIRAAKRRDETLRRQFLHARTTAFPGGKPQDRVLGVAAALNQYGPGLIGRLIDELPSDGRCHYVVVP